MRGPNSVDKKQLGERLKIARIRKSMTQLDVAVALEEYGVVLNQTAIGKIERGERNLYVHQLVPLLEILDISFEWLIKGGELHIS